jgi:hypothetical protein
LPGSIGVSSVGFMFVIVPQRLGILQLHSQHTAALDTGWPIKYGSSIGQSLQTLRLIDPADERILDAALGDLGKGEAVPLAGSAGLWTKCDSVFADYFLKNWSSRREPLAFLLYDPPPALRPGAPVFIHSDKNLRLLARFREAQFVAGYKPTIEPDERLAERERIGQTHREARSTRRPRQSSTSSGTHNTACAACLSWTRSRHWRRMTRWSCDP